MESRKITVVSTRNQKKTVIMSSATTLAELKRDLEINNINYSGMTFFEGVSRTELKDNNSILPKDVPYKGEITNELVFMLTEENKKISSGADRATIIATIKKMNLQEAVKAAFGRNFTQVSSENLQTLINTHTTPKISTRTKEKVLARAEEAEKMVSENPAPKKSPETVDYVTRQEFDALKDVVLQIVDVLDDELDVVICTNTLEQEDFETSDNSSSKLESSYAESDIDEMFSFVRK